MVQLPFFTPQDTINSNPLFFPWQPMPVIQGHPIIIPNPVPMDIPPPPPLGENEGIMIPVPLSSFTEISSIRNSVLMMFPEEEDKKYILNCQ
ncbi:hypothetical protein KY285_033882 [Solanum tuberosum]|nr:hypothetical protein KY284_033660 [Solanum tuberosum]KAH0648634.1 hypothetical protein KY285_033882 [Solanum tuberosum]